MASDNKSGRSEAGTRFDEVDSTGTNARPRHDTISQTGPGIPDDASEPVQLDPEEEKRIAEAIRTGPGGRAA